MAHLELRRCVVPRHLRKIISVPRDIERASEFPVSKLPKLVAFNATRGGTLFENGAPIVAGGITFFPSFAMAWLVASKPLRPYLRHILPEIRAQLASAKGPVLAQVTEGLAPAEDFARHVGFKLAGRHSRRTMYYVLERR